MGNAIEELAHFAATTPWETIPSGVRAHAKLVLLDTLGVILAGSVQAEVAGVRARLTATGGRGATVYAPGWPATDPRTVGRSLAATWSAAVPGGWPGGVLAAVRGLRDGALPAGETPALRRPC